MIVGQIKGNRKIITSTTSLWEPHSVYDFKKIIRKNITNNDLETEVRHHTLHTTIST